MRFGCYFINFDYVNWYDTFEEAQAFGLKSGFQFSIIKEAFHA